jgi:hypothetical protein
LKYVARSRIIAGTASDVADGAGEFSWEAGRVHKSRYTVSAASKVRV